MKKSELIAKISKEVGESENQVVTIVEAFIYEIANQLKEGNEVKIHGFGKFEARAYGERKCYNPQNGELITLPASTQPAFIPSGKFRELIK